MTYQCSMCLRTYPHIILFQMHVVNHLGESAGLEQLFRDIEQKSDRDCKNAHLKHLLKAANNPEIWEWRHPYYKGRPVDMGGPRDVWIDYELEART